MWLLGAIGGSALVLLGIGMVWIGGRRKVSEEQRAEAAKIKRELEEMMKTPGWGRVEVWVKNQVDERSKLVLRSPTKEPLEQEYLKGEVHGIELFGMFPKVVIEQMKEILAAYDKERGNVDQS